MSATHKLQKRFQQVQDESMLQSQTMAQLQAAYAAKVQQLSVCQKSMNFRGFGTTKLKTQVAELSMLHDKSVQSEAAMRVELRQALDEKEHLKAQLAASEATAERLAFRLKRLSHIESTDEHPGVPSDLAKAARLVTALYKEKTALQGVVTFLKHKLRASAAGEDAIEEAADKLKHSKRLKRASKSRLVTNFLRRNQHVFLKAADDMLGSPTDDSAANSPSQVSPFVQARTKTSPVPAASPVRSPRSTTVRRKLQVQQQENFGRFSSPKQAQQPTQQHASLAQRAEQSAIQHMTL